MKSFLEEHTDYVLAEAKSEVRKQEWRADFLDSSVRDLRQLDSNRLEIFCTNQGCEESRREQARLYEGWAQREKALRDTRIRNIHEVEELKRILQGRMERKSPFNKGACFTSTGVAGKNESYERF